MSRAVSKLTIRSSESEVMTLPDLSEIVAYETNQPNLARSHRDLARTFDYINQNLFGGRLPRCLITHQRTRRAYGYFSADRFINIDDPSEIVHEIALNPAHFKKQLTSKVLATLAHEMVHLKQHVYGKPSRGGYHNREWARMMVEIGLIPSSTGARGGMPTGERVSHYILPGGRFEAVCAEYLVNETVTLYQDLAYCEPAGGENEGGNTDGNDHGARMERAQRERAQKAASKTRFTCPRCKRNAWASPTTKLLCGNEKCDQEGMTP